MRLRQCSGKHFGLTLRRPRLWTYEAFCFFFQKLLVFIDLYIRFLSIKEQDALKKLQILFTYRGDVRNFTQGDQNACLFTQGDRDTQFVAFSLQVPKFQGDRPILRSPSNVATGLAQYQSGMGCCLENYNSTVIWSNLINFFSK